MRLIDADQFKEYITLDDDDLGLFKTEKQKLLTIGISEAIKKDIDEQPTIDAVEVVRCKDCKYFYKTYDEPYCALWSRLDTELPKETDFCSWAERKTDEQG